MSQQVLFLEEKQALVGRCSSFPGWEMAAPAQEKGFGAGSTVLSPGSQEPAGKAPGHPGVPKGVHQPRRRPPASPAPAPTCIPPQRLF